jgi:hypothetical protein
MMKTIIQILLLFGLGLYFAACGDDPVTTPDPDPDPIVIDENAQQYFDLLTVPLSEERRVIINQFIIMLKDSLQLDSLESAFDRIWLLANETEEAVYKSLAHTFTAADAAGINSPVFTVDRGVQGDGISSCINTNYNLAVDRVNYQTGSASFGVYSMTDQVDFGSDFGMLNNATTHAHVMQINRFDEYMIRLNNGSQGAVIDSISTSFGFYSASRISNELTSYQNGEVFASGTSSSQGTFSDADFYIGARWSLDANQVERVTSRQYSFAYIGRGFNADEMRMIYNCVAWYLNEIDALSDINTD